MSKVRIGDLIHRHKELIKVEDDVTYKQVTIRVRHKGVVLRGTQQGSSIGTKNQYVARQGQFILSRIDARQGAFGVVPPELEGAIITNDFWCFDINEQLVLRDFFYTLIQAPDFDEACKKASIGTTNRQRINEDFFLNYELDIPPLANQQAAVRQIAAARQNLTRIDAELTHQAILIIRLRQAVLREAVQGYLVPQDTTDEPAPALLARIRAEKQRLIKEKELRPDKPLPPLNETETPYKVPQGWAWCRLGEVARFIDYRGKTPVKTSSGVRLITAKNIKMGYLTKEPQEFIAEEGYDAWMTRGLPENGDVLFTTEAPLGNVAQLELEERIALAQRTILLRPYASWNKQFLKFLLLSDPIRRQIFAKASGMAAEGIKASFLKNIPIPLPPLLEQQRIVAKATELLGHCTALEAELKRAQQTAETLHAAALREAFQPQTVMAAS